MTDVIESSELGKTLKERLGHTPPHLPSHLRLERTEAKYLVEHDLIEAIVATDGAQSKARFFLRGPPRETLEDHEWFMDGEAQSKAQLFESMLSSDVPSLWDLTPLWAPPPMAPHPPPASHRLHPIAKLRTMKSTAPCLRRPNGCPSRGHIWNVHIHTPRGSDPSRPQWAYWTGHVCLIYKANAWTLYPHATPLRFPFGRPLLGFLWTPAQGGGPCYFTCQHTVRADKRPWVAIDSRAIDRATGPDGGSPVHNCKEDDLNEIIRAEMAKNPRAWIVLSSPAAHFLCRTPVSATGWRATGDRVRFSCPHCAQALHVKLDTRERVRGTSLAADQKREGTPFQYDALFCPGQDGGSDHRIDHARILCHGEITERSPERARPRPR